jgi:hypothetical protein
MSRQTYIVNIALFMIFLIITLPMYSSVTWAATINPPVQAYGKDKIDGYRAVDDTTVLSVSVTAPEETDLAPQQLKILEDATIPFDCALADNTSGTFNCKHEWPQGPVPSSEGILSFTLQLYSKGGSEMSLPVSGSLIVDSKPPLILSTEYASKSGGAVEASFNVKDEACDSPECANKCVGVSSVKFTSSGIDVGGNSSFNSECPQSGKVNLTGLVVSGDVQSKHICVEAADRFGQSSSSCSDMLVDARAPVITGIGLIDSSGKPLKYTNGQPIANVRLVVNITEDSGVFNTRNSAPNQIQVNASGLSDRPEHQVMFGSKQSDPSSCNPSGPSGKQYTCVISGLALVTSSQRDISVRVEAKDAFDNPLNETRSLNIQFDNVAPLASRIYSTFADDKGAYWLKAINNTITVDIAESGSGMSNRYVTLDFSSFGPQQTGTGSMLLAPNECVSGSCKWYNVNTNRPSGTGLTLTTQAGSRDDANNLLNTVTGRFAVDVTPPEPIGFNLTAISDIGESSYIGSGDKLRIHAYIEDHTPVKVFGNFTYILPDSGHDKDEGTCTEYTAPDEESGAVVDAMRKDTNKRLFDCVWEIGPLVNVPSTVKTLWVNTSFMLDMTDLVGNNAGQGVKIDILGRENVTGDYWMFTGSAQSPSVGLDRFTWGLSQPVSYQHIQIVPRPGLPAKIVSFTFDASSCVGDRDYLYYAETGEAGATYMNFDPDMGDGIDDIILLAFNPTNVPPINVTTEANLTYPLENLTLNCTAKIISVVQGARLSTVEEENITMHVSIYGNPLGQNIGNVRDYMNKIEDWVANGWWKVVKWPRIIFEYAQMVCTVMEMLNQVRALWTAVAGSFGAACTATGYFCAKSGPSNKVIANDFPLKGFIGKFTVFCGLVISCRATSPQAIDGAKQVPGKKDEFKCEGDSGFCKFQLAWATWQNGIIKYLSGAVFFPTASTTPNLEKNQAGVTTGGGNPFSGLKFADQNALRGSFDPKKSLIASLLTICLPGIFAGIEKYRQAMCEWLMCYKINIAYGSMTMYECDELFKYTICRYVLGEIWNAVPMFQFFNQLMTIFRDLAGNPILIVGYVVDFACSKSCQGPGAICPACKVLMWLNVGMQLAGNVKGLIVAWKTAGKDICNEALKDEPSYSNLPGFPKEADPANNSTG